MDGAGTLPSLPVFLGVAQAAEMVSLSRDSVARAIARGDLVGYRPGGRGRVLVRTSELVQWVEAGAHRAPVRGRKSGSQ